MQLRNPRVERYVFIDDFCGSGTQGIDYSEDILEELKSINSDIHVSYFVLFATNEGIERVRKDTLFDSVECIYTLDSSFKCFSANSRVFSNTPAGLDKNEIESMCRHYGGQLVPNHPLGYSDCQLLIGFHHNIPDNTIPIIWVDIDSPDD